MSDRRSEDNALSSQRFLCPHNLGDRFNKCPNCAVGVGIAACLNDVKEERLSGQFLLPFFKASDTDSEMVCAFYVDLGKRLTVTLYNLTFYSNKTCADAIQIFVDDEESTKELLGDCGATTSLTVSAFKFTLLFWSSPFDSLTGSYVIDKEDLPNKEDPPDKEDLPDEKQQPGSSAITSNNGTLVIALSVTVSLLLVILFIVFIICKRRSLKCCCNRKKEPTGKPQEDQGYDYIGEGPPQNPNPSAAINPVFTHQHEYDEVDPGVDSTPQVREQPNEETQRNQRPNTESYMLMQPKTRVESQYSKLKQNNQKPVTVGPIQQTLAPVSSYENEQTFRNHSNQNT